MHVLPKTNAHTSGKRFGGKDGDAGELKSGAYEGFCILDMEKR
jgi:hypothetical protein